METPAREQIVPHRIIWVSFFDRLGGSLDACRLLLGRAQLRP